MALVLAAAGCASGGRPALRVSAADNVLFDRPLGLAVTGARPGHTVHVEASSTDGAGSRWTASADFLADPHGRVDPAHAAPIRGSYTGTHEGGLLWSMGSPGHGGYDTRAAATMTVTFTATQAGRSRASATVTRQLRPAGVAVRSFTVPADPFTGYFFAPSGTGTRRPGVLVFGGSEGGDAGPALLAQSLAAHGYPALAVAYFKLPGLPADLTNIPLEYFAGAARWLATQPGVDPARLAAFGWSRGSEAAQLLGADFPDLVHAVLVSSPSSVVNPGSGQTAAWTLHGQPVPHVTRAELGDPNPPGDPAAVIPVTRIAGPEFLVCGERDELWPSCPYADQVAGELGGHPHTLLREPGAGHMVADVEAGIPFASGVLGTEHTGGTVQADALARLDAWPKMLAFLGSL